MSVLILNVKSLPNANQYQCEIGTNEKQKVNTMPVQNGTMMLRSPGTMYLNMTKLFENDFRQITKSTDDINNNAKLADVSKSIVSIT